MANTTERAFGWDDTIENDSSWVLLPEGTYHFTVTGFERQRHPGSAKLPPCFKAALTLTVSAAEGTTVINHNLFLHSKCEGLLCAFFTSIGDRKHGQPLKMDWDHVIGKSGVCKVGVREWIDREGASRQNNEIRKFLPPDKKSQTFLPLDEKSEPDVPQNAPAAMGSAMSSAIGSAPGKYNW